MDKEKKDYVPASQLKPEGTLERTIKYKPILGCLLLMVFGVAALVMRTTFGYILGGIIIVMSLIMLFGMKDKKVLDIYSEGVVVYAKESDTQAMYIPYDMISEWSVERTTSGTQVAAFLIKGKQYVYKETFRMRGFKSLFKKFMPDKEFVPPKKNKRY